MLTIPYVGDDEGLRQTRPEENLAADDDDDDEEELEEKSGRHTARSAGYGRGEG